MSYFITNTPPVRSDDVAIKDSYSIKMDQYFVLNPLLIPDENDLPREEFLNIEIAETSSASVGTTSALLMRTPNQTQISLAYNYDWKPIRVFSEDELINKYKLIERI